MINSRKLSVQALIRLGLYVEELYDEEAAVELSSNEPVEFRQKTINLASLAIQKKDIFRIREEMELPNGYPNIFDIFWQTCKLGETQFRLSEGKLSIQGEVQLFSFMRERVKTVLSCGMKPRYLSAASWTARA